MMGAMTAGLWSNHPSATSAGSLTNLLAERLVLLELGAMPLDPRLQLRRSPPTVASLAQDATKQPHSDRAPRNETDAKMTERRNHLELNGASAEVV
jgi:hypothetical protein